MTNQHDTKAPEEKICAYEYTVKRGDSFYLIAHRLGVPLRDLLAANTEINPARLMVGDVLCIPLEEDDQPQAPETTPIPQTTPETTPPTEEKEEAAPEPAPQTTVPPVVESEPAKETEPAQEAAPLARREEATPAPDLLEVELTEEGLTETALDQPAAPGEGPYPDQNTVCPQENRYVLSPGESVTDVLLRRGLTWHTLASANPDTDLTEASTGEEICLPEENIPCPLPRSYTLAAEDTLESVALRFDVSVGALLRWNPCLAPAGFVPGACVVLPQ